MMRNPTNTLLGGQGGERVQRPSATVIGHNQARATGVVARMADRTADRTVSIVIPVFQESDRINVLIEHLRRIDRQRRCEIVVVDGDPSCNTIAVIHDQNVIKLGSEKGRARQMNAGAALSCGDALLFLHADTYLPDNAIELVLETVADPRYVGGAFGFRFDSKAKTLGVISHMETMRARLTRLPFGDQAIFIRNEYFASLGGYQDIPIMEDLDLMQRVKRRGGRIKILRHRIVTSARRIEQEGLLYCAVRCVAFLFLYSLGIPPERLKRYYPDGVVRRGRTPRLRRRGGAYE